MSDTSTCGAPVSVDPEPRFVEAGRFLGAAAGRFMQPPPGGVRPAEAAGRFLAAAAAAALVALRSSTADSSDASMSSIDPALATFEGTSGGTSPRGSASLAASPQPSTAPSQTESKSVEEGSRFKAASAPGDCSGWRILARKASALGSGVWRWVAGGAARWLGLNTRRSRSTTANNFQDVSPEFMRHMMQPIGDATGL